MSESDRWFYIEQDRKREQMARVRRAQKRQQKREQQEAAAQHKAATSEWYTDEFGNLCRTITS